MNLVGYLITLANLQSFDRSGEPITDLTIKVAEIQTVMNDFIKHPEYNLENFRETGYFRQGNIGKYLSKNVRDYIYNGVGKPTDEAIVLTLVFNDATESGSQYYNNPDRTLSYFLQRGESDENVNKGINEFVNALGNKRDRRSLLNTTDTLEQQLLQN